MPTSLTCVAASTVFAVTVLAACTSDPTVPAPTSAPSGSQASASTAASAPAPAPTTAPQGAASDLTYVCEPDSKGTWTLTGTVKNSTAKPATYTVTVSIVAKAGSTVLASGSKVVSVPASGQGQLKVGPLDPKTPAAEAACVPLTTVKR